MALLYALITYKIVLNILQGGNQMISVKVLADWAVDPTIALPAWVHFTWRVSQAEFQFSLVWPGLPCHLMLCVLRFRPQSCRQDT